MPPIYTQTKKNDAFVTSTLYANALEVDTSKLSKSVFHIKNDDASIAMTYKIYGTLLDSADSSTLTDDEWVNLISVAAGGTYDHDAETALAATVRKIESLNDWYVKIVIQIKAASGTPTAKVWHGGRN